MKLVIFKHEAFQHTDGSYATHGDFEEKLFPNRSDKDAAKSDVTALKPKLWPGGVVPYRFNRHQIGNHDTNDLSVCICLFEIISFSFEVSAFCFNSFEANLLFLYPLKIRIFFQGE